MGANKVTVLISEYILYVEVYKIRQKILDVKIIYLTEITGQV